jgi:hypothetical protein
MIESENSFKNDWSMGGHVIVVHNLALRHLPPNRLHPSPRPSLPERHLGPCPTYSTEVCQQRTPVDGPLSWLRRPNKHMPRFLGLEYHIEASLLPRNPGQDHFLGNTRRIALLTLLVTHSTLTGSLALSITRVSR